MSDEEDLVANQFMEMAMTMLRPLIDDLARQVGESPEAWRGVSLVINGLGTILNSALDFKLFGPKEHLLVIASILAAIDEHPAMRAAEPHWKQDT